jgi:hypothetical protein
MKFQIRQIEVMSNVIEQLVMIEENGKEWCIPQDPANSDYQAYLQALEAEKE